LKAKQKGKRTKPVGTKAGSEKTAEMGLWSFGMQLRSREKGRARKVVWETSKGKEVPRGRSEKRGESGIL